MKQEMKMFGRSKFIVLAMLCTIVLAACTSSTSPTLSASTTTSQTGNTGAGGKLNLNNASGDEFMAAIPGLGNRMVREFQEYRPYISIQQFRQEIGKYVDEAQVAEYEKYVYVPISINDSDSETLQQIPGLDMTEAQSLISARPYASTQVFLNSLSQFISTDNLEVAKTYLGDH
jgi:DNA uptake protein ComE-like DNA-binding protein